MAAAISPEEQAHVLGDLFRDLGMHATPPMVWSASTLRPKPVEFLVERARGVATLTIRHADSITVKSTSGTLLRELRRVLRKTGYEPTKIVPWVVPGASVEYESFVAEWKRS